ncbi:MAG TPA: 30S ribosomal protein S6 [Candidatus Moranbacteria bacterium]|nr:30S ribosomal protein S6 [Candidatus Moranbacteria bacterium]
MQYEIFYLIGASKEADLDNIKSEVKKIVEDASGKFLEKETLEKRRLSYTVKRENHGIYIAQRFELENTENLQEITTKMNLNGNILRFMLSKAEDLPELKSKEERINDSTKKEEFQKSKRDQIAVEKTKSEKLKEEKPARIATQSVAGGKAEKTSDDDIDKKLEEILNI